MSVPRRSVLNFPYIPPVPAEQIRQLPTRDVALFLLRHLASGTGYLQYASTMNSARQAFQEEPDRDTLVNRPSDAWCRLETYPLLSREPSQSDAFRRIFHDGMDLAKDPQGITWFEARERLSALERIPGSAICAADDRHGLAVLAAAADLGWLVPSDVA
ncbi:hypothetical protein FNH08_20805, partial [Streptomyces spongiae]|nr:hypothetical protein [Streptomyces spongiae]